MVNTFNTVMLYTPLKAIAANRNESQWEPISVAQTRSCYLVLNSFDSLLDTFDDVFL